MLLSLATVWGSSFYLIKKSLVAFDPIQVACLRVSIAGIVLIPFFASRIKKINKGDFKWLVIVGLAGSMLPAFLFSYAQTHIPSAVAGMLNSLTPLFTLLIGVIFFSFAALHRNYVGVFIGLAGATILILQTSSGSLDTNIFYALLIVIGTICYGTSGNVVKRFLGHLKSFSISVVSYVVLVPFVLIGLSTTPFLSVMQTHPHAWWSLAAVAFLAVMSTAIASVFYFMLVQRTTPLFASTVTYLIPVIATFLGVFDGEVVTIIHFLGCC